MNWKTHVRARARADIRGAVTWYESQLVGLGDEFRWSVDRAVATLKLNPFICQIFYKKIRQILPDRFPYRIFYLVEGDTIIIIRVVHAASDFATRLG